jgi:hypothetical protein
MEEAFWIWAVALESGFLSWTELERWADAEIARLDAPPAWLLDLSLAGSSEEAIRILWQGWSRHGEARGFGLGEGWERGELTLGFLYLRFERGEVSMAELLKLAGDEADALDCGIDCEVFYLLLNEIDGGGPIVPSSRPLAERVAELFSPFAELARRYVGRLPIVRI